MVYWVDIVLRYTFSTDHITPHLLCLFAIIIVSIIVIMHDIYPAYSQSIVIIRDSIMIIHYSYRVYS